MDNGVGAAGAGVADVVGAGAVALALAIALALALEFKWDSDFQLEFQNYGNDADVVAVQSHEIVVVDGSKFPSRPEPSNSYPHQVKEARGPRGLWHSRDTAGTRERCPTVCVGTVEKNSMITKHLSFYVQIRHAHVARLLHSLLT